MSSPRKLFRRRENGLIAGVCSGIAEYLDVDDTVVRLVWVVLSIVPGGFIGGVVAYIAAWIVMPEATQPAGGGFPAKRITRSLDDRKVAGVCGGIRSTWRSIRRSFDWRGSFSRSCQGRSSSAFLPIWLLGWSCHWVDSIP
jgi:phage shock protein C